MQAKPFIQFSDSVFSPYAIVVYSFLTYSTYDLTMTANNVIINNFYTYSTLNPVYTGYLSPWLVPGDSG